MDEDGHILIILHEAPTPEDAENRRPFLLWGNPQGEWKSAPQGGGFSGLHAHLENYARSIHQLDDDVEVASSPREYFDVMRRAHPLLRATRNLLAVLEDARKARRDDQRFILARDKAIEIERAIDLATGDAKAGMDFTMAMSTEAQAAAAHEASTEARRLNRLAAFFFPLVTMAAIFSISPPMTVMRLPGFWAVLVVGIIAGLLTGAVITSRLGKNDKSPSNTNHRV